MKKVLLIGCPILVLGVLICGGLFGGLIWGIFELTKPPVEATEKYLALIGEGKVSEAYASSATLLHTQQTEEEFIAAVKKIGLTDYASASWTSRNIVNNEATLAGTITTKSGGSIPLKVKLVKEGEEWKVLSLSGPEGGVHPKEVPTKLSR